MATRRLRVEFIRFALLLTITVALISVATRHGDHGSGRNDAARSHQPPATTAPSSGASASAPAGGSSAPAGSSSSSSSAPAGRSGGSSDGTSGATDTSGRSAGAPGQQTSVPMLPRTGGTQAVELAAIAALFIAVGSFSMRISRPRSASQAGGAVTAAAQVGQAVGSSESNRPETA